MKHKKFTIDITDWEIDAINEVNECLERQVRAAVVEAIEIAMENDTHIYFPVEWAREPSEEGRAGSDGIGGDEVKDPLTVYLRIGLHSGGEEPTYEFNIREALQDTIDGCKKDGSFSAGLGRLSKSLKDLASDIDAAREIQ